MYSQFVSLHKAIVKDILKKELTEKITSDANVDNQCMLWLVYLFSSFLMPTSRLAMCVKLYHYLVNLDELDTLNLA